MDNERLCEETFNILSQMIADYITRADVNRPALVRSKDAIEHCMVGHSPKYRQLLGGRRFYFCPNCETEITELPNYCEHCGMKFKWKEVTTDGEA